MPPPHLRSSTFHALDSHSRSHSHNNNDLLLTSSIEPLRLSLSVPRDDSTRIQLQRQRLRHQNNHHHVTAAFVSNSIPGLKTSAGMFLSCTSSSYFEYSFSLANTLPAFFASLRTNLRLHASPPPSPIGTPPSMRASLSSLPPSSPLSGPADSAIAMDEQDPISPAARDPLAGVPELQTYLTSDQTEKVAAIKLTADSVAQMRQAANSALLYHPLNAGLAVAALALLTRAMRDHAFDWTVVFTTLAGLLMTLLASCRWFTKGYLFAAEDVNWAWRDDADVIVTKFGDEVIGTVMIDWVSGEGRQKRKKAWRGEIKAWTVRLRYRNKGVGYALLEEAVKEAHRKGAETIEFADDHASEFLRTCCFRCE